MFPDHIYDRLREEKRTLDNRLRHLAEYMDTNPKFMQRDEAERERMARQRKIMEEYGAILQERLDARVPAGAI